jgi:hypothetical protein
MNKHNIPGVLAASRELEAALGPLGCRPHWGKLHHMGHHTLTQAYGTEPSLGIGRPETVLGAGEN